MRFIDIGKVELPNGWEQRAAAALNELRNEIIAAENAARAAGNNANEIRTARKQAISAGLKKPSRRQIWADLSIKLKELSNGKCWYSESKNPMSDKDVDHFRPKNRVDGEPTHEGYWWLAFDWRNYRYSCQWCNQYRVDRVNNTSGGKADRFPLLPNSFRAQLETDDYDLEDVVLLDPINPEDWKLLTFRTDGYPTPAKPPGTIGHARANASILIYHLHYWDLVKDRRTLASTVKGIVQDLEDLRPQLLDRKMQRLYIRREIELLRAIHKDSEYSAAALAYARAEIYTMKRGHQSKRGWLEEILNSNS